MNRYSIGTKEIHHYGGHYGEEQYTVCDISIEPHPEGGWVKFEDVEEVIKKAKQETIDAIAADPYGSI